MANVLEGCLGDFDLTDADHAGIRLLFDNVDFSFLIPEQRSGTFFSISSIVAISEHGRKPKGESEVSHESQDRLHKPLAALGTLMKPIRINVGLRDGALVA